MTIKEFYRITESDYEDVMRRLGKESLVQMFVQKLSEDKNYERMKQALRDGDLREAFERAHTLKGIAGNLGLKRLYEAVFLLVENLRNNVTGEDRELVERVDRAYTLILSNISLLDKD